MATNSSHSETLTEVPPPQPKEGKGQLRRVLISSYLGSAIEFYDFLVYGTAASLVFGPLFFAHLSPWAGTVMSFVTLAAGYLARPLGGAIFGHFGDKLGRKKMLVLTMLLMGIASSCIGLIPTYATIGVAAPILLVTLRIIQGIAIGGEWGGATLMALEHSGSKRRGLAVGIVNAGAPSGAVLATLIMGLFSLLPEDQFLSWGWRIPFLLSAVLVVLALVVRLGVHESPVFKEAQSKSTSNQSNELKKKPPIVEILRHPKKLILTMCAGIGPLGFQSLMATFALTFAVSGGVDRTTALFAATIGSIVNIASLPAFAALSDRVGRRAVLITGLVLAGVGFLPIFNMIGSGDVLQVYIGYILGYGLIVGMLIGTLSAFISEQFSTGSRYTGASLGYQLGATLGAGFAPVISANLLHQVGTHTAIPVAVFVAIIASISLIAVIFSRESAKASLHH